MQSTAQQLEAYVPVFDTIPQKWEDARQALVEYLKKISNAVNVREIGWLLKEELLSGQQFFQGTQPPMNLFRSVFRKVVDFGPLPNTGTKVVAHGISTTSNTSVVQLYAAATQPAPFAAIPIPYADPNNSANNISLGIDSVNVIITTATNYNTYTRCFITISYIQEL